MHPNLRGPKGLARALTRGMTKAGIEALVDLLQDSAMAAEVDAEEAKSKIGPDGRVQARLDADFLSALIDAVEARCEQGSRS